MMIRLPVKGADLMSVPGDVRLCKSGHRQESSWRPPWNPAELTSVAMAAAKSRQTTQPGIRRFLSIETVG